MEDILNQISGLTSSQRKKVLSWVASIPEEKIVEIFQSGVKISYQIKAERPDLPGKYGKYCAFILAARTSGWDSIKGKGYRVAEKKQYDDFSDIRKSSAAELINKGRTPVIRRKVLAYWGEVKELKYAGMGFRPISEYLSKTRKIKVSASYILKMWKEIEQ